jgi:hypothetical protein
MSVNFRNLLDEMLLSIVIFLVIQVTVQILEGCHTATRVSKKLLLTVYLVLELLHSCSIWDDPLQR